MAHNIEAKEKRTKMTRRSATARSEAPLRIAAESFLLKGYVASSIDEIAAAAGMTGPALYRIFTSKQDILDQICLLGMKAKMEGVKKATEEHRGDPEKILRALVERRISFASGPWGCQVPITWAEYRHLSEHVARWIDGAADVNRAEWFRNLVQIRPELSTKDALAIIFAVLTMITYTVQHIENIGPVHNLEATLAEIAWSALMV